MTLNNPTADGFVPQQGLALDAALSRTTHLGIGAHQDDLEFGALPGILDCFGQPDRWFTGITCTDGGGSPRAGVYADYTDDQMKAVRVEEQRTAAMVGRYSAMLQLGYPSSRIKDSADPGLKDELVALFEASRPSVIYTHNPADKHATHVAVFNAVLQALRERPQTERPQAVYGVEIWRGLDWMPDEKKVVLPVDGHDHLIASLQGVFDSQIAGGKRYDLAAAGRYRSNATFFASHGVDTTSNLVYAMDLMPLVENPALDPADYVIGLMRETEAAIRQQILEVS
jgi:LmbE family N-acetylglucosaminyl deacetylase